MTPSMMTAVTAHAQYEMNILFRSWFFRIYAILALLIITSLNLVFFTTLVPTPWIFKGMSSFPAYVTAILINQGQSALIIFLATDIFKRDLKMDSSEVIQIRSMTNLSYIWGKMLGIVAAFVILDAVIFFISAVIHLGLGAVDFSIISYVLYPIIILLPSMVFAIGLSFFLMRYFKNQAVSILIMLGIMGVSLFFLINKADGLYDFIGIIIPLAYSDFTGITNWQVVLTQRFIYFLLGISFLFWISYSYQRLEQSFYLKKILAATTVFSFLIAAFFTANYIQHFSSGSANRVAYNKINQEWSDYQSPVMKKCDIDLIHSGNSIAGKARLLIKNESDKTIEKLLFNLNPGLSIASISDNDSEMTFRRNLHLIIAENFQPLAPGDSNFITIEYSGQIDEAICFAQVDEEIRSDFYQVFIAKVDKKYAFLETDYLLLPPNSLWYPSPGLPVGSVFPKQNHISFTDYSLNIKVAGDLKVYSQGKRRIEADGSVHFSPETPLPYISLIAGKYEERTRVVDSVAYSLVTLPDHDYYLAHFDQIDDTLEYLIRELKQDYERTLELDYPFKRLLLIETPIQYVTYKRNWTAASAYIQPEQIWFPENGMTVEYADFPRRFRRQERFASDYTLTDVEKQNNVLKEFFQNVFLTSVSSPGRFRSNERPDYNIFPNYYTFTNYFPSDQHALINNALESFLLSQTAGEVSGRAAFMSSLTIEEQVCQALDGKSFKSIIKDENQAYLLSDMLKVKGEYLLSQFQFYSGSNEFYTKTMDFIIENRFKRKPLEHLFALWKSESDFDTDLLIEKWMNDSEIPSVLIKDLELYKVYDKDRIRYQVRVMISNPSPNDALIKVSFSFGGRRQSLLGTNVQEEAPKTVLIQSNTAKEVGIILDDEPNRLTINSLLAKNIPLQYTVRFEKTELRKKEKPFDGEIEFEKPFLLFGKDEIVIDNEDATFTILDTMETNFMRTLFGIEQANGKNDFVRFQFWRPPDYWRKVKNPGFYGEYIHSAYYINSGSGDRRVEWQAPIAQSGYYEIYVYVVNHQSIESRRFEKDWMQEHDYTVFHDDGEDSFNIDVSKTDEGWNSLGSFYLSEGKARVRLSNKTQGRFVIADAVKWVKK